jgi:hypothetical protein
MRGQKLSWLQRTRRVIAASLTALAVATIGAAYQPGDDLPNPSSHIEVIPRGITCYPHG